MKYALETVPGVAEVASIGGFVRQYQVRLDPNKLLAYGIPLSMVIDRVKSSTNEVGGRVLDLSGAQYMIRGRGYLHSPKDLESVSVGSKNGTPVFLRDLGSVTFGPEIREGVAEWNGEGETVGGIIVMRQGMNALKVIDGVKQKLHDIASSLPAGVQIAAGYDRSRLIKDSIATLERDLLEEALIVSLVILIFLFHFRSALIVILILPVAVLTSFIPIYLPRHHFEHHVIGRDCTRHRSPGRRGNRYGGERLSPFIRKAGAEMQSPFLGGAPEHSYRRGKASGTGSLLLPPHHHCFLPAGVSP